jgi:hypothetical protein
MERGCGSEIFKIQIQTKRLKRSDPDLLYCLRMTTITYEVVSGSGSRWSTYYIPIPCGFGTSTAVVYALRYLGERQWRGRVLGSILVLAVAPRFHDTRCCTEAKQQNILVDLFCYNAFTERTALYSSTCKGLELFYRYNWVSIRYPTHRGLEKPVVF